MRLCVRARSLLFIISSFSVVAVVSCGDDGSDGLSDEEQTYADAWAATLADAEQEDPQFTAEEAACLGAVR